MLDASVLITASNQYYEIGRVREFWDWLIHMGETGNIKIPLEIYEEVKDGNDELTDWINLEKVQLALYFDEAVDINLVRLVTSEGYAPDLTDDEVDQIGRDPFLIAYAMADPSTRRIVTTEVSKSGKTRANRHIPDVCNTLNIISCDTFRLTKDLDFRTDWKK